MDKQKTSKVVYILLACVGSFGMILLLMLFLPGLLLIRGLKSTAFNGQTLTSLPKNFPKEIQFLHLSESDRIKSYPGGGASFPGHADCVGPGSGANQLIVSWTGMKESPEELKEYYVSMLQRASSTNVTADARGDIKTCNNRFGFSTFTYDDTSRHGTEVFSATVYYLD